MRLRSYRFNFPYYLTLLGYNISLMKSVCLVTTILVKIPQKEKRKLFLRHPVCVFGKFDQACFHFVGTLERKGLLFPFGLKQEIQFPRRPLLLFRLGIAYKRNSRISLILSTILCRVREFTNREYYYLRHECRNF